jgi:hypothetical protein
MTVWPEAEPRAHHEAAVVMPLLWSPRVCQWV